MNKYPKYKSSGVEWIGDIPEHWEMIKLKYLGKSLIGLSYQPEDIVEDETEGLLVLRSSNIQNGKLSMNDNVYVKSKVKEEIIVREGDILVCSRNGSKSLIGKNITITKELEGNTFGVFMTIFRTPYWNYISKVFNSKIFKNQSGLFLTSTINQLTQETLNNFIVPFVHKEKERYEIVQFLDDKIELIDKLISTKERKIDLLKSQRTSLINEGITKGLDPNVKMKNSGVEWIGDIPEHWKISPLKYFGIITLGKMLTPEEKEGYTLKPYLRSQNVQIDKVDISDIKEMWFSDNELQKLRLKKGDLLINEGGDVGRTSIWNEELEECYFQNSVNRVQFNEKTESIYYFLFQSHLFHNVGYYNSQVNGVSISHLTKEKLESVRFLRPPLIEQLQIVEYLTTRTIEIDKLVSMEQKKIDLLKEYRQSLISEVITGKIDVRTNLN